MSRRRLGEAMDSLEQRVEAVIAALHLGDHDVTYERIAAGITNHNWLVGSGDRAFFVKLFGEGTEAYIDRTSSNEASRIAGELGVGPRVVAYLPDLGAEVFAYLDGYATITSQQMLEEVPRRTLLGAYRRMHQAGRIGLTRPWFEQLAARASLVRESGVAVPGDLDHLLWQCRRAQDAVVAAGIDYCVCHNDSYAANFLINPAGDVRVIDWEYAANNDPAWDLAMLSMGGASRTMCEGLAFEYRGGKPDAGLATRIQLYAPIVLVSWGLWAAHQAQVSAIPFDYRSYSRILFQLGRLQIGTTEWEAALWQV